ncbi:partial ATP-dependent helicase/nuclease subunit A, partial [Methylacidimicrobium cyclopophantes]
MGRDLPIVRCCLIRASAGTGKTEELARRIVELLRWGVEPERIVAITFTRMAAAEILDRVLGKLADQAEEESAGSGRRLEAGGFPRSALASLQAFLEALPRLQLRTIDSLFQRIVRVCPVELGLPENFELMDEFEARELRRSLLGEMLREGKETGEKLLNAVARIEQGEGGKSVWAALDRILSSFWEAYAEEPDRERWGGETLRRALNFDCGERDGENLWEEVDGKLAGFLDERRREEWRKLRSGVLAYRGGAIAERVIANILGSYDPKTGDCREFSFQRKKIVPDRELARLCGRLVRFWLQNALESACERTRGIASILGEFHERYRRALRVHGRVAFSDAP